MYSASSLKSKYFEISTVIIFVPKQRETKSLQSSFFVYRYIKWDLEEAEFYHFHNLMCLGQQNIFFLYLDIFHLSHEIWLVKFIWKINCALNLFHYSKITAKL